MSVNDIESWWKVQNKMRIPRGSEDVNLSACTWCTIGYCYTVPNLISIVQLLFKLLRIQLCRPFWWATRYSIHLLVDITVHMDISKSTQSTGWPKNLQWKSAVLCFSSKVYVVTTSWTISSRRFKRVVTTYFERLEWTLISLRLEWTLISLNLQHFVVKYFVLVSPRKYMLWPLIQTAISRRFQWWSRHHILLRSNKKLRIFIVKYFGSPCYPPLLQFVK